MSKQEIQCAVMFIDVADSTRLYEMLGDKRAQDVISTCLKQLSDVITDFGGVVIKTIGDEIMCRFNEADMAISSACAMHEILSSGPILTKGVRRGIDMEVRVGMHFGTSIMDDGDLFGDAVNVAARMTAIAKAGQIITTSQTINLLSTEHQDSSRFLDRIVLKGKTDKVDVYEVAWSTRDEFTRVGTLSVKNPYFQYQEIALKYKDQGLVVDSNTQDITIGRDESCEIIVITDLVSRTHCILKYTRGKFVLVDQSTNGTFIIPESGEEVFLKREEFPLWGEGVISLGQPVKDGEENLIHFKCS